MKWILKGICFAAMIALAILGFGYVTMSLWNWLMPPIFGLTVISFKQAIGILILGKILFGGFRRGGRWGGYGCGCGHRGRWGRHGMWKKRWEEKMAKMSPEEREKVKQYWGNCGWDDCETDSKIETDSSR